MSPLPVCFLSYDRMSPMKTGLACFAHSHPQAPVVSNMAQGDVAITCWRKKGMIQSHGTTRSPSDAFIKSATAHEQARHNENETPRFPWWPRCSTALAGGGATAWRWGKEHSLESCLSRAEHQQIITYRQPNTAHRHLHQRNPGVNLPILVKSISLVSCLLLSYETMYGYSHIFQSNYSPSTNSQLLLTRLSSQSSNHVKPQNSPSVRHAYYSWHFMAETLHLGHYL